MNDEALTVDVAGQPGGPSPEEQARVDAEQKALMAQRQKEWAEEAAAERAAGTDVASKVERAQATMARVVTIPAQVDDLKDKVERLEKLVASLSAKAAE